MKIYVIKAFSAGVFQYCWEKIICSFFSARHTRNFPAGRSNWLVSQQAAKWAASKQKNDNFLHHGVSKWACGRNRELWLVPNQEVRESRTSGSSTQTQKFETIVVANGYKNAPSHISELARETRALDPWSLPAEGSWALGTRMNWPGLSIPEESWALGPVVQKTG